MSSVADNNIASFGPEFLTDGKIGTPYPYTGSGNAYAWMQLEFDNVVVIQSVIMTMRRGGATCIQDDVGENVFIITLIAKNEMNYCCF